MGSDADWRIIHNCAVFYYDYERLRAILQNLYVLGNRPCSAFHLCGTADRECGKDISKKLLRRTS